MNIFVIKFFFMVIKLVYLFIFVATEPLRLCKSTYENKYGLSPIIYLLMT